LRYFSPNLKIFLTYTKDFIRFFMQNLSTFRKKGPELKLNGLKQDNSSCKVYMNQSVPMFENLVEYYSKSAGKTKKDFRLLFQKNRSGDMNGSTCKIKK